jgi:hypothetical protein
MSERQRTMTTTTTTHSARITQPLPYRAASGQQQHIPKGPCLVENSGGPSVEIIWGAQGQRSAALTLQAMLAAQGDGHLVLLD